MKIREYVGARYVMKIYENSLDPNSAEWEPNIKYEPLTMVTYNGSSYISRNEIPANIGNPVDYPTYWAFTGSFTGQIAQLQSEIDFLKDNKGLFVSSDMYNLISDGVTDNYSEFLKIMADIYNAGGGILYLANGTYLTTNTIPIPPNTTIIGESFDAVIYFDGTVGDYGTTLAPVGDNITIKNLSVEYIESDKTKIKVGTQYGGIGITNRRFIPQTDAIDLPGGDVSHIIIDNLYSTNTSPIQIETSMNGYTIRDCHISNVKAPNAQLRCSPTSTAYGYMEDVYFSDCDARSIGIGYGSGNGKGIFIENSKFHSAIILDANVSINNCCFEAEEIVYHDMATHTDSTYNYCMRISFPNTKLTNVRLNNNGISAIDIGIYVIGVNATNSSFANVIVNGFNRSYSNNDGIPSKFVNCSFDGTNVSVFGTKINSDIDCNPIAKIKDYDKYSMNGIVVNTGFTWIDAIPNRVYKCGNSMIVQIAAKKSGDVAIGDTIATMNVASFRSENDEVLFGTLFDSADPTKTYPIMCTYYAADGTIKLTSKMGLTYTISGTSNIIIHDVIYNELNS